MQLIGALALGFALMSTAAEAQVRRFVFGGGAAPKDTVSVAAGRAYADGFGFEGGNPALFSVAVPPGN